MQKHGTVQRELAGFVQELVTPCPSFAIYWTLTGLAMQKQGFSQ
jgi:hypothetical protein